MQVVGIDVVDDFIRASPETDAEFLRAWIFEIARGQWRDFLTLRRAFASVTIGPGAAIRFELAACPLVIDTVIDFRVGVMLVLRVAVAEHVSK